MGASSLSRVEISGTAVSNWVERERAYVLMEVSAMEQSWAEAVGRAFRKEDRREMRSWRVLYLVAGRREWFFSGVG